MDSSRLMIVDMATKCREIIRAWNGEVTDLPQALQQGHLLWMCDEIEKHAEHSRVTKLHRWIGFIQGAILANRMIDFETLKEIFREAKGMHGQASADDEDLLDHLDPASPFEFDIGGQG